MRVWKRLMLLLRRKPEPDGDLSAVNARLDDIDDELEEKARRRRLKLEYDTARRKR